MEKKLDSSSFIIFFLFLCAVLIIPKGSFACRYKQPSSSSRRAPTLFIFGDSIFDVGNNNYINTTTLDQANFWPYGETYFNFPTGRFSDGRLIPDFIAEYAKLPPIPPFLQPGNDQFYNGANFASAGAGALVETFQGAVINLKTQLKYYKKVKAWMRNKLGDVETKKTISGAVHLISIGSNDYMSPFLTNSSILTSYSPSQYVDMVIGNLTTMVKEIYSEEGRKFGFLNLGDVGCLPGLRILQLQKSKKGCLEEASMLVKLHNHELKRFLSHMKKQLHGFRYSLFDFNHSLRKRMNHPTEYGFKEGKTACCGIGPFRGIFSCGGKRPVKEFELCQNPNQYVLWDSYHPTERIYKQMADQMWGGEATKETYDIKTLFQCF